MGDKLGSGPDTGALDQLFQLAKDRASIAESLRRGLVAEDGIVVTLHRLDRCNEEAGELCEEHDIGLDQYDDLFLGLMKKNGRAATRPEYKR